jgi:hypothetical protein
MYILPPNAPELYACRSVAIPGQCPEKYVSKEILRSRCQGLCLHWRIALQLASAHTVDTVTQPWLELYNIIAYRSHIALCLSHRHVPGYS